MLMLSNVLSEQYGLTNPVLTPAPRGFVAETYYVDSDEGRHFAKLVKISDASESIDHSLPVLHELHRLGVERINYPILTVDGQYRVMLGSKLLVLFNYVKGKWVFDYPFEPYARLLGQIHRRSDRIQTPLVRTTFDLPFREVLLRHLERVWTEQFA